MVITVTCPSCSSSFPVDPAKIPEGGVNARCSSCGDVFRVEKPAPASPAPTFEAPAPPPPPPPAPEPVAPPEPPEPPEPPQDDWAVETEDTEPLPTFAEPEPEAAPAADPFAQPAPFEEPAAAAPASPPPPAPEPESEPAVQGFTFGKRDPTDKAKRLARVLVSDMIMYNAERHQAALAGGTLVQDFEEEIDKSWKEFVDQVGDEIANGPGRGFWTEALNDILAKGQQVF